MSVYVPSLHVLHFYDSSQQTFLQQFDAITLGVFENLEDAIKAKIEMENKLQYHENHCKGGDV